MKIQKRTEYGVRALVLLAASWGDAPLARAHIAEAEQIPGLFLDQILGQLRREGLVTAVRGANGGYLLARAPCEITLAQVITALEGSLSPIGCVGHEEEEMQQYCQRIERCQSRSVWIKWTESITAALTELTLGDVIESR